MREQIAESYEGESFSELLERIQNNQTRDYYSIQVGRIEGELRKGLQEFSSQFRKEFNSSLEDSGMSNLLEFSEHYNFELYKTEKKKLSDLGKEMRVVIADNTKEEDLIHF
jgi:hypothetical protein